MSTPECSICCDEITVSTGSCTLSCSHQFHLGCIGRWFGKSESCPMCRAQMTATEKIQEDQEDEEEEDSEEEEEEEEEDEDYEEDLVRELADAGFLWTRRDDGTFEVLRRLAIPKFDEDAHALWAMRTTFEKLEDGLSIITEPDISPSQSTFPLAEEKKKYRGYQSVRMRGSGQLCFARRDMVADRGYSSE